MPNHIKNKVFIHGPKEEVSKALEAIKGKVEGHFIDFEKIIPFPNGTNLNVDCNGLVSMLEDRRYTWQSETKLTEFTKKLQDFVMMGRSFDDQKFQNVVQALKNKIICDYASWYDWSITHWGTKWNSYDNELKDNLLTFETAWAHPFPVVKKLSEMWPALSFEVLFADENIGSTKGTGHYAIKNGDQVLYPIDDLEKFAVQVWSDRYKSWEDYISERED